jgi:DDE superfamily endonuclease
VDEQSRPRLHPKKGRQQRLTARALANPSWGLEYLDETWFVFVPPTGIMNPEDGRGWAPSRKPPRNRSTRKKGQQTWNAYVSLDAKENRLSRRYTKHTNRWETALFVNERVAAHERLGHQVLVLIWDPAPWHVARDLMNAFRAHNRQVDRQGHGVKLVPVVTPVHAFWLNRVEPILGHAKRKVLPCRQFTTPLEQQAALDRHWLHRNLRCARAPSPEDLIADLH